MAERKKYRVGVHQRGGQSGGIDLSGQKFGRLMAIRRIGTKRRSALWLCECSCGNTHETISSSLRSGSTQSCGCLALEVSSRVHTTHGLVKSDNPLERKAYNTLVGAIKRCHSPSHAAYGRYGGRGVTVCDEWRKDVTKFITDVGLPPTMKHTIDRINNDLGYFKGNCRWVTSDVQTRNKSDNIRFTVGGVTKVLSEWCREYGHPYSTVYNRLKRGMAIEQALTKEVKIR